MCVWCVHAKCVHVRRSMRDNTKLNQIHSHKDMTIEIHSTLSAIQEGMSCMSDPRFEITSMVTCAVIMNQIECEAENKGAVAMNQTECEAKNKNAVAVPNGPHIWGRLLISVCVRISSCAHPVEGS